jgi:argininosuccinate synthase
MKVVLAYSGGLDTSVILKWIKETYQAEVICFAADVGQEEELKGLKAKAKKSGALKCYVDDLREEFARDFVFPMIRAGGVYESGYLLGTSIARPLIAKRMVEIAIAEGADAIAHGATGKGNDQVRFEITAYALKPNIKVIAPWREERYRKQFNGRADMLAYCAKHGIPVEASAKKPYSMDRNLLHISFEGGILEMRGTSPRKTCSSCRCRRRRRPTRRNMWRSISRPATRWR